RVVSWVDDEPRRVRQVGELDRYQIGWNNRDPTRELRHVAQQRRAVVEVRDLDDERVLVALVAAQREKRERESYRGTSHDGSLQEGVVARGARGTSKIPSEAATHMPGSARRSGRAAPCRDRACRGGACLAPCQTRSRSLASTASSGREGPA